MAEGGSIERPQSPSTDVAEKLGLGRARGGWLRRSRLWLAGLLVLALLGGLWLALGGNRPAETLRYVTEAAKRGPLTVTITATGTVEPTNEVEISSELSGIVRKVLVDYNDRVTAGQVLAELDTDKLQAEVAHSRATLDAKRAAVTQARATLAETKRDYDRTKPLAEKRYSSEAALDAARAGYERAQAGLLVAQADVEVAEAQLQIDETNLGKAAIRSPIDGVVLKRNVEPGQTVASSLQAPVLFTLAENLGSMQIEADVDEADVGKVREGQHASFTVEAYQDRAFDAALTELRFAPKTVEGVVTYTAVLSFDNAALLLRPGMTATAEIVVQQVDDALLIPNAALRFAPPQQQKAEATRSLVQRILPHPPQSVAVPKIETGAGGERQIWVRRDGTLQAVAVRIGASDGSWTEVLDGALRPGDAVVVDSVAAG
ncbi:HlyD family secretion protein [Tistlia consotensis]|uniref:HlyD family secretion protein n=1 Tax=Tistlia consotensis USBA 355 TaxID=560819 RepID=A0A1Y6BSN8_9PROT|nr:efflux RND transporter periplasmic adaptor subunit [Tistlia consotensis]SMF17826.1 HlyD family secretion protein [Tistlia consotensis USBA 355]SNR40121.1 HlyD family secretion protein [Tistlia consotensis]